MSTIVERVLSQRTVGYNFTPHYGESIVESACAMSDGTEQLMYTGYRTDNLNGMTKIHEYGKRCPHVDRSQEQSA